MEPAGEYQRRQTGRFGYCAVGVIPYSHFFGNVRGLSPGEGVTIYFPPLVPVQYVAVFAAAAIVAAPMAVLEAALSGGEIPEDGVSAQIFEEAVEGLAEEMITPESTRSGFEGALSDVTYDILSDFSFDMAINFSRHTDDDYGGALNYTGLLLGVRLAGPRRHLPRYYVCGGLGWYWFEFENRPDASVPGPYVGVGAEFFTPGDRMALGIEYRANFYFGDDKAGDPVDGGQGQLLVLLASYW
jgi:hypothetical protein